MFEWIETAVKAARRFLEDQGFRNEVKEALWEDGCESAAALISDLERIAEKTLELFTE